MKIIFTSLTSILFLFQLSFSQGKSLELKDILKKEKIRIIVTDSGLGGLSVAANLEKNFNAYTPFTETEILFINSLPENNFRYNDMESEAEKAQVFNSVLESINKIFSPDIILIACNTLSIVYPLTDFYLNKKAPVIGIIDFGVNKLFNSYEKGSSIIIFGTETTINSNVHKNELINKGIDENEIVNQSCPELESEIQNEPNSVLVDGLIDFYTDEAVSNLATNTNRVLIGLCCSHYGYVTEKFVNSLKEKINVSYEVINPNDGMVMAMLPEENKFRFEKTEITTEVISQVEITEGEIKSISQLIKDDSEKFAESLINYRLIPNLFSIKK